MHPRRIHDPGTPRPRQVDTQKRTVAKEPARLSVCGESSKKVGARSAEESLIFVSDLGCGPSLERLRSSDDSVEFERGKCKHQLVEVSGSHFLAVLSSYLQLSPGMVPSYIASLNFHHRFVRGYYYTCFICEDTQAHRRHWCQSLQTAEPNASS